MSCTVVAVPFALSWVFQAIAGAVVVGGVLSASSSTKNSNVDLYAIENNNSDSCDDFHKIEAVHFIEKEFETPLTDKKLLVKTLEEHGVKEIEASDNYVFGKFDGYTLQFNKYDGKESFTLRISCSENENVEEKVNDITSEYSMNVQEDVYLHIIEKLKENNMQIEEETVEDDNTIVLTVNLE